MSASVVPGSGDGPDAEAVAQHLAFMAELGREADAKGYMPPMNMVQAYQAEGTDGGASVSGLLEEGNAAMKGGDAERARELYTEALEAVAASPSQSHPKLHILFANRSAARLKLNDPLGAVSDAEAAVSAAPNYVKGWFRLASAHAVGGDIAATREAAVKGLELDPKNRELKEVLKSTSKVC